jgi:hypothetical protein
MLKVIQKITIKSSLILLVFVNSTLGKGFVDISSESTFVLMEAPNFEGQLVRINIGVNLIRLNTDILENMPISVDSTWVDDIAKEIDMHSIRNFSAVKNDPYYSTVHFTNSLLDRGIHISLTPLGARTFHQANIIYKTIPNMNIFPNISDAKTFMIFKDVEIIDVEAINDNLFKNVEEATISLLPEDMIERVLGTKEEYKEAKIAFGKAEDKVGDLKIWLNDEKNDNTSEIKIYKEYLELAETEAKKEKEIFNLKEEIYFKVLKNGALSLEVNYDKTKLPLAKKLEKLLNIIDDNAMGATSMFLSSMVGLTRGLVEFERELLAINKAIIYFNMNSSSYGNLQIRQVRMLTGTLMAIPNIGVASYYALKQSNLASKYQMIVDKIIEAGKIDNKLKKESK